MTPFGKRALWTFHLPESTRKYTIHKELGESYFVQRNTISSYLPHVAKGRGWIRGTDSLPVCHL